MNNPATTAPTMPVAIEAFKLRPGDKVLVYGTVPVTITEAKWLPEYQPCETVKLTYRCDNVDQGVLIATRTVPAGQTFPVYDDGLAF